MRSSVFASGSSPPPLLRGSPSAFRAEKSSLRNSPQLIEPLLSLSRALKAASNDVGDSVRPHFRQALPRSSLLNSPSREQHLRNTARASRCVPPLPRRFSRLWRRWRNLCNALSTNPASSHCNMCVCRTLDSSPLLQKRSSRARRSAGRTSSLPGFTPSSPATARTLAQNASASSTPSRLASARLSSARKLNNPSSPSAFRNRFATCPMSFPAGGSTAKSKNSSREMVPLASTSRQSTRLRWSPLLRAMSSSLASHHVSSSPSTSPSPFPSMSRNASLTASAHLLGSSPRMARRTRRTTSPLLSPSSPPSLSCSARVRLASGAAGSSQRARTNVSVSTSSDPSSSNLSKSAFSSSGWSGTPNRRSAPRSSFRETRPSPSVSSAPWSAFRRALSEPFPSLARTNSTAVRSFASARRSASALSASLKTLSLASASTRSFRRSARWSFSPNAHAAGPAASGPSHLAKAT